MDRQLWTDQRIDDVVERIDKSIDLLRADIDVLRGEIRDVRGEIRDVRGEMREGFALLESRMVDGFSSLRRDMLHAVLAMSGAVIAALVTVIAAGL